MKTTKNEVVVYTAIDEIFADQIINAFESIKKEIMSNKKLLKSGNMVYPLPAVLISCCDKLGNANLITVAWTGTICSDPAMLYVSVRKERYSYHMIEETGEFVLNLTTKEIAFATDICGVKSGKDIDKWTLAGLTKEKADIVKAPMVKESPVNIECKVVEVKELGSHDMFIANVVAIHADKKYFDEKENFDLEKSGLLAYVHGEYYELGKKIGSFGYSVKKNKRNDQVKEIIANNQIENNKKPKCEVAKKCGACKYSNLPYDEQLIIKQKYINNLFSDFVKPYPIIGMEKPYNYRNKVHHVFDYTIKNGIISGSYVEGTHKLVNIDNCLIEDSLSQNIIKTIRDYAASFKYKTFDEDTGRGFLRHVVVRRAFKTGEIMVVLVCADQVLPSKNNFVKALLEKYPEITTIILNVNNKKTSMVLGNYEKVLYGKGYIEDKLYGCQFKISSKSFYQINPVQTEILYRKAIDFADLKKGDIVIDAYCGIGTIGICAAKDNDIKLLGIELNKEAINDARANAKINGIRNARFIANDATEWMESYEEKADVVFMDPPRTGSNERFIKAIKKINPRTVVYISCGPESLVRDLKIFKRFGYDIEKIQPVDLFPLTEHVETVVLMSRVDK